MLEIQIGDKISQKITGGKPLFNLTLWNAGQWKSTTLMQFALELIKQKQTGLLLDPYGDLANNIRKLAISTDAKNHLEFFHDNFDQEKLSEVISSKFVIISFDLIKNWWRNTRETLSTFLNQVIKNIKKDGWLIIDEALELIDDELFNNYFKMQDKWVNLILSDQSLLNLSEKERTVLLNKINSFIIYKTRNINAQFLEKNKKEFSARSISAIQQYHFQYLSENSLQYSASVWPLKEI